MAEKNTSTEDFVTLMIVPHGRRTQGFNLRVPYVSVRSLLAMVALALFFVLLLLVYSTAVTTKLLRVSSLAKQQDAQNEKLSYYADETKRLSESLQEMAEREKELSNLLGLRDPKQSTTLALPPSASAPLLKKPTVHLAPKTQPQTPQAQDLGQEFKQISAQTDQELSSMRFLSGTVHEYRKRFLSTPSIWPVFGYSYGGFGMRIHPVTHQLCFHPGIDIPTYVGAPVKATASGRVRFAGWEGAYGLLVVIDHGYGYSTAYGHNSRLLVNPGDYVSKGMLIAKAGSTGLSTGPHVHYEVHRWGRVLQPGRFLNVDMLTACARLW